MNGGKIVWQIERAANLQEYRGGRPEIIVISPRTFDWITENFSHLVMMEVGVANQPEAKLCGMKLRISPWMPDGRFILGMEYKLEEESAEEGTE